jgi:hypothetical protein
MDNTKDNTEINFMNEMKSTARVYILIGAKGSGKSFFINSFLKYSMNTNLHQYYYLVIPAYTFEQYNSYSYLKGKKNVKIYNKYKEIVGRDVLENMEKDHNKSRSCFIIDDATGFINSNNPDEHLKYMITTSRHLNCDIILCVHGTKAVLSSVIKANVDFLFLFKIINSKLLEVIYEEYIKILGCFYNKDEFINYYNQNINGIKYNSLFLDFVNNTNTIENNNYLQFQILKHNTKNKILSNNINGINKGGDIKKKEGEISYEQEQNQEQPRNHNNTRKKTRTNITGHIFTRIKY